MAGLPVPIWPSTAARQQRTKSQPKVFLSSTPTDPHTPSASGNPRTTSALFHRPSPPRAVAHAPCHISREVEAREHGGLVWELHAVRFGSQQWRRPRWWSPGAGAGPWPWPRPAHRPRQDGHAVQGKCLAPAARELLLLLPGSPGLWEGLRAGLRSRSLSPAPAGLSLSARSPLTRSRRRGSGGLVSSFSLRPGIEKRGRAGPCPASVHLSLLCPAQLTSAVRRWSRCRLGLLLVRFSFCRFFLLTARNASVPKLQGTWCCSPVAKVTAVLSGCQISICYLPFGQRMKVLVCSFKPEVCSGVF